MQATGQVDQTHYVHRVYEESHVRFRLVSLAEPSNPEVIVGAAVELRFGDPKMIGDCSYESQVFGNSSEQFRQAADAFKKRVTDYIMTGRM